MLTASGFRKSSRPGPLSSANRSWAASATSTALIWRIPILDDTGRLQGVITAGLDLHWLGSLLAKSDFPPGTALVLTDATGKVLFRYPEPLKYIGRMLPEALIKAMTTGDEGVAAGVGLPGDERLFAFTRLSPPWQDLRVAIGLPKDMGDWQG